VGTKCSAGEENVRTRLKGRSRESPDNERKAKEKERELLGRWAFIAT
jgi:hypothetical protein